MNDFNKNNNLDRIMDDAISLNDWISDIRKEEEKRDVFLNMDRAMKYLHNHDYCVKSFDPNEISILNHSTNQIKFNKLLQIPNGSEIEKEKIIKQDIYNSSFIQIGLYTNTLSYLKPEYLKENFDDFARFIPDGDVPYYKGVIQRGASVYFCEFAKEKRKRDLESMDKEFGEENMSGGMSLIKTNGKSLFDDTNVNDSINDSIYGQLNRGNDAAFISYLVYPTIVLTVVVVIALLAFVISLI